MANLNLIPSPALHPHLLVSLPTAPDAEDCRYHLSLSFPDSIFVDRDEIKDLWDKGGGVAWSLSPPEIDIERPVRGDQEEAVRLYIEVASTVQSLDIPLHARYLRPNSAGREEVQLFAARPSLTAIPHGPLSLSLPTGDTSHQALVLLVTPLVIWLGWTYLAGKIKALHRRVDTFSVKAKTA